VRTIAQETLVLWGRQDNILDPVNAERFLEEVPDSRLVWVEDCGHVAHLEQPTFMRDTLFEFAKIEAAPAVAA
jgi:pimeloyl-ACP methyl ester carboxylesterase